VELCMSTLLAAAVVCFLFVALAWAVDRFDRWSD
jgi:hypothetical protein